jgi:hypothetical protein
VLVPWLERAACHDVHADTEELLEVLEQADMIKKRCTRLEVNEQIRPGTCDLLDADKRPIGRSWPSGRAALRGRLFSVTRGRAMIAWLLSRAET